MLETGHQSLQSSREHARFRHNPQAELIGFASVTQLPDYQHVTSSIVDSKRWSVSCLFLHLQISQNVFERMLKIVIAPR
jgi:hypothetical protein